jgi:hypothetical protein
MKEYRHCQPLHNTQRKRGREGRIGDGARKKREREMLGRRREGQGGKERGADIT